MNAPESPLPNLRLRALADLCRAQWRDNPLCRRVWRRIRPWALVVACIMALQSGAGVLMAMMGTTTLTATAVLAPKFLALAAGMCFFGLLALVCWIGGPIWYTLWAHRTTWTDDENLRTAPVPKRERFVAIAVPAMVAMAVIHVPSLLLGPYTVLVTMGGTPGPGMPGTPTAAVAMMLSYAMAAAFNLAQWMLLLPTVMLRVLLQDSVTGAREGRTWISVAWPFATTVAIGMAWGMARQMPMVAIMFAAGPGTLTGASATLLWIGISAFQMAGDVAVLFGYYAAMRAFWRRDIPAAKRVLYEV